MALTEALFDDTVIVTGYVFISAVAGAEKTIINVVSLPTMLRSIFAGSTEYQDKPEADRVRLYRVKFPLFFMITYFVAEVSCIMVKSMGRDVKIIDPTRWAASCDKL